MFALIPARNNSKRFPGKNIALLNSKPLIAYTIEYAIKSKVFDRIFVSTDSKKIADIAIGYGAEILNRPNELATDIALTSEVVGYHARDWKEQNILPEWITLLQPTNPLRPKGLIENAMEIIHNSKRDSLVTFSPLNKKYGIINDHGFIPENYTFGQRMQDIEPRYFENGLLYIIKGSLACDNIVFGDNPYPLITHGPECLVDIDEPEDLLFAEWLLQKQL